GPLATVIVSVSAGSQDRTRASPSDSPSSLRVIPATLEPCGDRAIKQLMITDSAAALIMTIKFSRNRMLSQSMRVAFMALHLTELPNRLGSLNCWRLCYNPLLGLRFSRIQTTTAE